MAKMLTNVLIIWVKLTLIFHNQHITCFFGHRHAPRGNFCNKESLNCTKGTSLCVLPLVFYPPKLSTSDLTTRYQPSTITNSNNLNGSEIITGGNMNIPMDIRVLATTMSIIKNGT